MMPVISYPVSGIATAGMAGLEVGDDAGEYQAIVGECEGGHTPLCDCVEELGKLKEMAVVS